MARRTVYLHAGRSTHPIYREQLHAVPEGFTYRTVHPELEDDAAATRLVQASGRRWAPLRERAEATALRLLGQMGHVRRVRVDAEPGDDLIHSAELLLRDPPRPYVVDFEHVECFVLYQRVALSRPWARQRLLDAALDPRCHALMAWSDWARAGMLQALGPDGASRVADKVVTVHPAIRPLADVPRSRSGGPLRVLFIGTKFYEKGAIETIQAVRRVRATHDVVLDLVSYVPTEWEERLAAEPAITAHTPGGHGLVRRLYAECDVLLFPSHMDTFGYVIMEANAYGLPVLGPDHQAIPELIDDGETGLLFRSEEPLYGHDGLGRFPHVLPPPKAYMNRLRTPSDAYVDSIAASLARIAEDADLHSRLAAGALERVRTGMFAVDRRRDLLARIYGEAAG